MPRDSTTRTPSMRVVGFALVAVTVSGAWLVAALNESSDHPSEARACVLSAVRQERQVFSQACNAALLERVVQEPYDGSALAALALAAGAGGDRPAAVALAKQAIAVDGANRLALRQLFADSLASGDFRLAAECLDRLLRTAPELGSQLAFAVAQRLDQPALRTALAQRLQYQPPWGGDFIRRLSNSARIDDIAALLVAAADDRSGRPDVAWTPAMLRLLRAGRVEELRTYFARAAVMDAARPGELVRDAEFRREPETVGLGWEVGKGPGARVRYLRDIGGVDGGLQLESDLFSAQSSLASQVLLAPRGRLDVEIVARSTGSGSDGDFFVSLRCQRGASLGKQPITAGKSSWLATKASFEVPADCPVQTLAIVARNSDIRSSASLEIDRISARSVTRDGGN